MAPCALLQLLGDVVFKVPNDELCHIRLFFHDDITISTGSQVWLASSARGRDQNTTEPLRRKRLMTLVQLFLIHRRTGRRIARRCSLRVMMSSVEEASAAGLADRKSSMTRGWEPSPFDTHA
jgi:hypothetical protein